jgi:hypothetical protein
LYWPTRSFSVEVSLPFHNPGVQRIRYLEAAASHQGVSVATARKWLGRFLAEGETGLMDRSSRPRCSPRSINPATALLIVELRRRRLIQARQELPRP